MQPFKAIFFKVLSVFVFVAMLSLIKSTSNSVPAGQAVFFRSLFAIPIILGWLAIRGDLRNGLKTKDPVGHILRGLIGTTAMGLGFAGLGYLPLPEVTAIGYAAPLLLVIFAAVLLKETVGLFRYSAVAAGLVGVAIVLWPRLSIGGLNSSESFGALIVLGSAMCAALAQIFIRKLTKTEGTAAIVFWFSMTATLMSLVTLFWGWVIPTPREAMVLILAGLLGGFGQIFLTTGYRLGDASLVAPFEYVSMLLAIGVGYFVFQEVPTSNTLIGAAIIIAAGVVIILRERYLGIQHTKQRKAMTPQG